MYRSACAVALATATLLLCAGAADAQTKDSPDIAMMSLQDLLEVEVVATASKFPQEIREAPASVSIITADDIRRYGHRTLADVLRSVRGLYTTYDRNYSYVGMRGFARPGDYNTRVLLLLDGHRLNDPMFDGAAIGTDFPIDISLIDRIEVIRGPGSALYGTNAVFGVINIVTRTGGQQKGVQLETYGGSLETRGASLSFGHLFANKSELLIGASTMRSAGATRLFYPEFQTEAPGSGIAAGLDDDEASTVFGSFSIGRFALRGGVGYRDKQVPTASFGTAFGDGREFTEDLRAFASALYDGPVGGGWFSALRLAYDHFHYAGQYPFATDDAAVRLFRDGADSRMITTDANIRRRFFASHLLTIGTEVRVQLKNHQWDGEVADLRLDVNEPGTSTGVYLQDEIRPLDWLIVTAGARLDRYSSSGSRITPRAAAVILPRRRTSLKLLHGRAFRAPNAYESYYYDPMREGTFVLVPETVTTTEAVWEERLTSSMRSSVTAFRFTAEQLVEQRSLGIAGDDLYFVNGGASMGTGVEGEIELRLPGGLNARLAETYVRASDRGTGEPLTNSPRHLSKAGVQVPLRSFYLGVEGQYVGRRQTLKGESLAGFFMSSITLSSSPSRRLDASVSVHNAFDTAYADPAAGEHEQSAILQDGRTIRAKLRFRF